jgi:hypothetical protein
MSILSKLRNRIADLIAPVKPNIVERRVRLRLGRAVDMSNHDASIAEKCDWLGDAIERGDYRITELDSGSC